MNIAMRNPIITMLLALSVVGSATAQEYQYVPFPTANAHWHTDGYDGNCLPPGLCFQSEVAIAGDTVVNGHTYTMVNGMDNGVPWEFSRAWFREDVEERKVYAMWPSGNPPNFDGAVEYVAYDFSLAVGDTFIVPPPLHVGIPGQTDTTYYVITSIDSVHIGDVLRKRFWFYANTDISSNFWIEGIGGEPGPFITHYMFEGWNVLRCMYHEGELVYSNPLPGPPEFNLAAYPWYEYCGPHWVGIDDLMTGSEEALSLSPNPATDVCHLRFPPSWVAAGMVGIEVVNMVGATVLSTTASPQEGSASIAVGHLGPGLYTVRLRTSERQFPHLKLIIR
jgi:hypothetical protein